MKKKITLISVFGVLAIALGVLYILEPALGIQQTDARYSFQTQASTSFQTGPFNFERGNVEKTLYLDADTLTASTTVDVKNFIGGNHTTQDISYVVSITDGSHTNHTVYDFSVNGVSAGSGDTSAARTLSGSSSVTDTLTLTFERKTLDNYGDTVHVVIKSLSPYEKILSFDVDIVLPTVTVTFDANGGSVSESTTQVKFLSNYSTGTGLTDGALPTPTRRGYYFAGWYEDSGGFDYVQYYTKYGDIYNAFHGDQALTTGHWNGYGALEGRDGRNKRIKPETKNTHPKDHTVYAMWVSTERKIKLISPVSTAQTLSCSMSDGTIILPTSTSPLVSSINLSSKNMSATITCTISAAGYETYTFGPTTITSKNFNYTIDSQGIYIIAPSLNDFQTAPVTVNFDYAGGNTTGMPSSTQVNYLSNYGTGTAGNLPTPKKEHNIFEGWYLGDTKITDSTQNTQTSTHTLTAHWSSSARTITLVSTATQYSAYTENGKTYKSYSDDEQIMQCLVYGSDANPNDGRVIINETKSVPSSGSTSVSGTYYLDEGDYVHCSVLADGYELEYSGKVSYGDSSAASKTITLSPSTKLADISGSYSNTDRLSAATDTLSNARTGIYLVQMWGGSGGVGDGDFHGTAGSAGYVYGTVEIQRNKQLAYSLGGNGTKGGNTSGAGTTAGGANGGGTSNRVATIGVSGGSGGGYSSLMMDGSYIGIAAGGGGGGGTGGSGFNVKEKRRGDDGGAGGSSTSTAYGVAANSSLGILAGYAFLGGDGVPHSSGTYSTGENSGKGGTGTAGGADGRPDSPQYSSHSGFLTGGPSINRGGAGGAGLYGGGGGASEGGDNTGLYPGAGGGGSSYLANIFTFSGLSDQVRANLSSNPSSTGGALIITYLGKNL